jgi:F-type H+-transporting ATPase subunit epsilon
MAIQLDIIAPDRIIASEEVDKVVCPGIDGEFGVLPGHVGLMTKLRIGEVNYYGLDTKKEHYLVVTTGYVEVTKDKVTILPDWCIRSRDIDKVQTEIDLNKAEEILDTAEKDTEEYAKARDDYYLAKAILKLWEKVG